jgi:hypothetical protein
VEELKKPFFIAALVLFGLVVLIELGSHFFVPHPTPDQIATAMCTSDSPPPKCLLPNGVQLLATEISGNQEPARPGLGITYLALVDAVVLFTLLLIGSSLIVPASVEGRVQGCATLIFSIVLVLLSIILIFVAFGDVILMISLLLSFPFGTIAYMIIYGFFDRTGAGVTLSLIMLLKIASAVCLFLAQPRFLQNIGFVVIIAASLVASVVVAILQGLPPGFLVSITDGIAALIVGIIAVIALILLLVGSIPSIIKALNPAG